MRARTRSTIRFRSSSATAPIITMMVRPKRADGVAALAEAYELYFQTTQLASTSRKCRVERAILSLAQTISKRLRRAPAAGHPSLAGMSSRR